jgi:hypothetical protein
MLYQESTVISNRLKAQQRPSNEVGNFVRHCPCLTPA